MSDELDRMITDATAKNMAALFLDLWPYLKMQGKFELALEFIADHPQGPWIAFTIMRVMVGRGDAEYFPTSRWLELGMLHQETGVAEDLSNLIPKIGEMPRWTKDHVPHFLYLEAGRRGVSPGTLLVQLLAESTPLTHYPRQTGDE